MSKLTMRIRPATIHDAPALARIQVDSYRTAYAGLMPPDYLARFTYGEQEQDWRDLLDGFMTDVLLVCETDGGQIAGYALGRPGRVEELAAGVYDAELLALHVRRAYQKQGIGRALVAAMARELRGQGCASLVLFVLAGNPARGFYEHLGGLRVGEKCWPLDEFDFDVVEVAYAWDDIRDVGGER